MKGHNILSNLNFFVHLWSKLKRELYTKVKTVGVREVNNLR